MSEITNIRVTNLFGYLNYRIALNQTDRITIIHGPNGCGKTWILQLISYVFSLNHSAIRAAPFEEIEFSFRDGGRLTVRKEQEDRPLPYLAYVNTPGPRQPIHRVHYRYESHRTKEPKTYVSRISKNIPLHWIERDIPQLERVGSREWFDRSRNEVLTLESITDIYGARLPFRSMMETTANPDWLISLSRRVKVSMIQSQRLIRVPIARTERGVPTRKDITAMVESISNDLVDKISSALKESVRIAQSKDGTFPARLLSGNFATITSETLLREELDLIKAKRQELYAAGLLDQEEPDLLPRKSISKDEQKVLSLYLLDVKEKLRVFDDLQIRIATLMNLINSKIENQGKSMMVNRDRGFLFKTEHSIDKVLLPSQMSSGEQHQLVLFYELLFNAENRYFILIDEPEISLNVGWQRRFLTDLSKVMQLGHHYVLMATHSPQIIHDRWDLAVPLSGGVKE